MSTVLVISGAHSSRHARRVSRVPPFIQNKNTSAPSTSTLCVRRQLLSGQGVRRLISFQCLRSPEVSMTVPQAQPAYRRGRPVVEVTNVEEMTSILEGLHASCGKWHAMPSKQKISILQQVRRRAVKASMDLGKATAKVSGFVDPNDSDDVHPATANMMSLFLGPTVARTATAYIKLLDELEAKGAPAPVEASRKTADGRNVLDMGTCAEIDGILNKGGHAYLYTQTGKELTQGQEAAKYLSTESAGVAVVLGAGNQGFLSMEDSMYMLFDKNMPVLLKHHPIQGEVAQMWEYIMEPLENVGVYKGVLADQALTQSALYSELTAAAHLTGAVKTYESILWGPGAEGEKRKAADDPLLKVPFTAELGNATPLFITPAEWTAEELQRVAKKTVFATTNNAGCNCLAPKVILMSADWPQADEFESIVKESFKKTTANPCWYPGAKSRYDTFLAKHPGCDMVESMVPEGMTYSSEVLPWAFKSITLDKLEDAATIPGLLEEFFAPVVIFLRLPSDSSASTPPVVTTALDGEEGSVPELSEASTKAAESFLKTIPGFCEKYVFGNLTCGLFLPDTVRAALPETSQNCIDNLQYGQVVVNNAPIGAYSVQRGTWGAWMGPKTSQKNVGSGIGKLHNFRQIDGLEKFVLDFPASHNLELGDPSAIPGILVPLIAGISGGYGIRGVWAAISPW